MWRQFALAVAVVLVLCYVPGYLFSRAVGTKRITSLVVAPLISICLIGFSGIAIYPLGLRGVTPLLGSVCLFILIAAGLSYLIRKVRPTQQNQSDVNHGEKDSLNGVFLLITAVISTAIFFVIFHKAIRNPSWFLQSADNYAHLAYITRSVQSGVYSMLHAAFYTGARPELQTPFFDEGFYPNALHSLAAITTVITGLNEALTENVVWFVFVAVIYPVGICALLQTLGIKNLVSSVLTSFVVFAQLAFPLRMVTVHAVFPNVMGFCAVPIAVVLFILTLNGAVTDENNSTDAQIKTASFVNPRLVLLCAMGILALAMMHPSADFFWAIFVLPYVLCSFLPRIAKLLQDKFTLSKAKGIVLLAVLEVVTTGLAVGIWVFLLNTSFLAPTVNFVWEIYAKPLAAAQTVLNFGLLMNMPQVLFAVAFWIGFVSCILNKNHRWLTLAFLMTAVIYVASLSEVLPIKRFFSGFWYTDPERTAAMVTIAAVPIAIAGMETAITLVFDLIKHVIKTVKGKGNKGEKTSSENIACNISANGDQTACKPCAFIKNSGIFMCIVAVLWGCALLSPWDLASLPRRERSELRWGIIWLNEVFEPREWTTYKTSEDEFVRRALQIVGDDLVVNNPYDGSLVLNSLYGMNIFYREKVETEELPQSTIIRTKLNEVATNPEVQQAVRETGARYVLLLDLENPALLGNQSHYFSGLQITDEDPGFEIVLREGPYRLYRITAVE
mgnify:CR=1 FL=1